jgi:hypothetical protein
MEISRQRRKLAELKQKREELMKSLAASTTTPKKRYPLPEEKIHSDQNRTTITTYTEPAPYLPSGTPSKQTESSIPNPNQSPEEK